MTVQRANLMMLIVILLLVVGLCIPAVLKVRAAATRKQTVHRLKTLGLGVHAFHDNRRWLPPIFDRADVATNGPSPMPHAVSFHVHLLPFIEQNAVYATYLHNGQGDASAVVSAFLSESDGTLSSSNAGVQCYAANLRVFSTKGGLTRARENMPPLAKIEPGRRTLVSFETGTSNLIMLAPKLAECGEGGSRYAADPTSPYAAFFGQNAARTTAHYANPESVYQWAPRGTECLTAPLLAQTYAPQSLPVAMADGTVRAFPGDINPGVWNRFQSPHIRW